MSRMWRFNRLISNLIDSNSMEWKIPLIEANFDEDDVKKILDIPLSALFSNDELTWALTKNGDYSVRTAYVLVKGATLITSIMLG